MDLFGMPRTDFDKILDYEYKLLHVSNTIETRAQAARDIYDYLLKLIAKLFLMSLHSSRALKPKL